jgi:DNA-binding XRE family transcriptional regulator
MQTFDRKTLKSVRKRSGLTQKEMADLMGVGRLSVLRWENGDFRPNKFVMPTVISVVNTIEDELAGRK